MALRAVFLAQSTQCEESRLDLIREVLRAKFPIVWEQ